MDESDNMAFDVSFLTKGMQTPPYYSLRLRHTINSHNLEFELIHHKLYAKSVSLPERISKFEITDGFNILLLNYKKLLNKHFGCRGGL